MRAHSRGLFNSVSAVYRNPKGPGATKDLSVSTDSRSRRSRFRTILTAELTKTHSPAMEVLATP